MPLADDIARRELAALAERGLLRRLEPLRSPPGAEIEIGPGERLINFSSNDYLGLAGDARIAAALARGAQEWGAGAGASRLVTGDFLPQHELEEALAAFAKTEAALLFNSGYAANTGLIPSLAGAEDLIVSDALNHASLIDGCRLSKARVEVTPHKDLEAIKRALQEPARRKLIVTDAIFSMDGDRAPLRELVPISAESSAMLLVDEAHSTGIVGPRGAGLCAELGIEPDVRMATLSKSFGVAGAFIAASKSVCDLLLNRARPLIFSTALPPALACAALQALQILEGPEGDARRATLWSQVREFAAGLRALGLPAQPDSPIFSIPAGTPQRALEISGVLRDRGILAKPIRPPTVPQGTSRLRIALSAAHTPAHLQSALSALRELM